MKDEMNARWEEAAGLSMAQAGFGRGISGSGIRRRNMAVSMCVICTKKLLLRLFLCQIFSKMSDSSGLFLAPSSSWSLCGEIKCRICV